MDAKKDDRDLCDGYHRRQNVHAKWCMLGRTFGCHHVCQRHIGVFRGASFGRLRTIEKCRAEKGR